VFLHLGPAGERAPGLKSGSVRDKSRRRGLGAVNPRRWVSSCTDRGFNPGATRGAAPPPLRTRRRAELLDIRRRRKQSRGPDENSNQRQVLLSATDHNRLRMRRQTRLEHEERIEAAVRYIGAHLDEPLANSVRVLLFREVPRDVD